MNNLNKNTFSSILMNKIFNICIVNDNKLNFNNLNNN
jgi:hypothetical protein